MRDYRAYIFGIDGHRFVKVDKFASNYSDDAAALSAAKELVQDHDVELWECGRLIARLSPEGDVASPELAPFTLSGVPSSEEVKEPAVGPAVARDPSTEHLLLLGW